jgi:hypothetical protein
MKELTCYYRNTLNEFVHFLYKFQGFEIIIGNDIIELLFGPYLRQAKEMSNAILSNSI